jgi:uncharacterized Fe-S cluster-containing radical SAM superfamily enzyme
VNKSPFVYVRYTFSVKGRGVSADKVEVSKIHTTEPERENFTALSFVGEFARTNKTREEAMELVSYLRASINVSGDYYKNIITQELPLPILADNAFKVIIRVRNVIRNESESDCDADLGCVIYNRITESDYSFCAPTVNVG